MISYENGRHPYIDIMRTLFRKILTVAHARSNPEKLSCKVHTKGTKEKPRHKFVSYVLTRYVKLVKSWEETFQTAAKFYKTFSAGIKEFKDDSLLLFNVYKKLNFDGIYCLTRKELEIYHEMPKNIIKVTPFVIAAALPFGAALFAVGCMFPKRTLSPHFWSEEQKNEFALIDHKKKLQFYGPIISCLESRVKTIKCHTHQLQISIILEGLKLGITPTVEEVIGCKQLFQDSPFNLRNLGTAHTISSSVFLHCIQLHLSQSAYHNVLTIYCVYFDEIDAGTDHENAVSMKGHLLNLYTLHRGWRRKSRLEQFAVLVKAMDKAIMAEGGLHCLTPSELKWASFFRGLNPNNMSNENIKSWLNNWLLISKEIDETCYSLLLHCPVFLGFNEPTNIALVKNYRN